MNRKKAKHEVLKKERNKTKERKKTLSINENGDNKYFSYSNWLTCCCCCCCCFSARLFAIAFEITAEGKADDEEEEDDEDEEEDEDKEDEDDDVVVVVVVSFDNVVESAMKDKEKREKMNQQIEWSNELAIK